MRPGGCASAELHAARTWEQTSGAAALNVSDETVKTHVASVLSKLQVENRAQAGVQALKGEPGGELQIWGSSKLLQTLLQHELVDRFRLMTVPLVLGSGRRLFNDGILPATMRPVDLTTTDLGIVIGTYEPAGPVRHGQM